ncbi:MAG: AMP-binding protein [Rhizobiales bacterium]|nr:AMP-binding protein [Hyphomicrobiales bacterium]
MSPAFLVHHLLDAGAPGAAGGVALIDGDRSMTYPALRAQVDHAAAVLQGLGLARGDRVAIVLPKSLEECWAIFATSRAGGVFVPVNSLLHAGQIRHIVADCGARIVLTHAALAPRLQEALAGIEGVSLHLVDAPAWHAPSADDGAARPLLRDQAIGEDLAAILYTSGSTGRPKGVMLSHRNLIAGTRIVRSYLGLTGADRILSVLPFSFDYGLNQLLTAVEQGAVLILLSFRFGDEIVAAIRDHNVTGLAGVPTIWAILTRASPSLARTPLPSLRYITNSGGAVPSETVKRLRQSLPDTRIFLMYGLTEAFRSTFLPPDEIDRRPTSIGRAIPETEIFAVTAEGRRTRPGEPGILVHRGPTVSLGYWNRPEDTAEVLKPHPFVAAAQGGDIVCYSGDLVFEDEEGFFHFVGRRDAMIKSAGYRISPTEVEEVLMATGAFVQVAVIGLPDPFAGQKVHAVGVAKAGAADVDAVLQAAAADLPAYMVPRAIEWVEALPVTPNGKVDYRGLVADRSHDQH